MDDNIALSIKQITKLLQNSKLSSCSNSQQSLSHEEQQPNKANLTKIVSFVDLDEFQDTAVSSCHKNSLIHSISDKLQELEAENKELKEQLIAYKIKEHKWNNQANEYQIEQRKLKTSNWLLMNKLRSIKNQREDLEKFSSQSSEIYYNTDTKIHSSVNKTQFTQKTLQIKSIPVNQYCGVSGIKSFSPHRMYGEKKTDRTIY